LGSDVKVAVKFHPRETAETRKIFMEQYHQLNCMVLEETIDLNEAVQDIDFCIGMYSKFLEYALAYDRPVVVYNPTQQKHYSIYNANQNHLLYCDVQEKL